jgi:hypothetical protein
VGELTLTRPPLESGHPRAHSSSGGGGPLWALLLLLLGSAGAALRLGSLRRLAATIALRLSLAVTVRVGVLTASAGNSGSSALQLSARDVELCLHARGARVTARRVRVRLLHHGREGARHGASRAPPPQLLLAVTGSDAAPAVDACVVFGGGATLALHALAVSLSPRTASELAGLAAQLLAAGASSDAQQPRAAGVAARGAGQAQGARAGLERVLAEVDEDPLDGLGLGPDRDLAGRGRLERDLLVGRRPLPQPPAPPRWHHLKPQWRWRPALRWWQPAQQCALQPRGQ